MKQQIPVGAIIAAAVVVLGVIGFFVMKLMKGDDTQGVTYGGSQQDYRKRMSEKMGGTGSGGYRTSADGQGGAPGAPNGSQQEMGRMRMQQHIKNSGGETKPQ
jgi:hypothetical protein